MKPKILTSALFLIPFVVTTFNVQALVALYMSESMAQVVAYGMIGLVILGIFFSLKNIGRLSKTAGLWIGFYMAYFAFGTTASIVKGYEFNFLVSLIPVIYFFGFYIYLSKQENRWLFKNVALFSYVVSSIVCIFLFKINWDLDHRGIYIYKIERAGGLLGDANNAALVAVVAFIFVYKLYNPTKKILKHLKLVLLLATFYCLVITFSTTGYFVFIVSFTMLNLKYFTPKRMLLVILLIPVLFVTLINLNNLTAGLNLSTQQRAKVSNIVNLVTFNTQEVDNSGRGELLENLLVYVYKNPFLGNGIDFAKDLRGHNTVVGVWADAGIFALLIFLVMLGNYFRKAIIAPPDKRYFALSILVVLCIFMLTLQTVINQEYLIALFVYVGYVLDENSF